MSQPKTILVVDDEQPNLRLLKAQLESSGYRVVSATSGPDGLEVLLREPVDLAVLDVMMGGMNGFEVLVQVRATWPELPVIMLTALTDQESRLRGLKIGANDYLSKPVDSAELLLRVRNLLLLSEQAAELSRRARELEEANVELDTFASVVAHDLREPLLTILGFAEAVKHKAGSLLDPDSERRLGRIVAAATRGEQMVKDLLELARLGRQPVVTQRVELAMIVSVAKEATEPIPAGRNVQWKVDAGLPIVEGDPSLLQQVFVNLFSNALKFTRTRELAIVEVRVDHLSPSQVQVSVSDNGVGFDPAHAQRLFDPFQRLHPVHEFEGNGIGLSHVKRIVQRLGGSVVADGEAGSGATFRITLPRWRQLR